MIPNGIDTSVFRSLSNKNNWRKELNLPQGAQILVYAGRFSSDKYHIARIYESNHFGEIGTATAKPSSTLEQSLMAAENNEKTAYLTFEIQYLF